MRHYSVTVAGLTSEFVACSDAVAFEAVADILGRKAFRKLRDDEAFEIAGPEGPVPFGHGTLGDIRA